jgi:hypothetical protein
MAVPRPLLLTLLGTVLLAATFFATRSARDRVAEEPAPAPVQQASRPAPEAADKSKPQAEKSKGQGEKANAQGEKSKPRADKAQPAAKKERQSDRGRAAKKRRGAPSVAASVKRAVAGNRLVVLFFYARNGADDRRVARSVDSLQGRTKALVFRDRIANLGRYGQIATSVGVSRSPSIVIIGKRNRGRLIEGYVDPDTLAQRVADER